MTRINALPNTAGTRDSVAWGKWSTHTSALVFAAVLIVCSVTVGCSSSNSNDQPKPATSNNQIPVTPQQMPIAPAPAMQAENKPAAKKVVHKKPATVNYTDKNTGVTFEYPRRYAIETGAAATELLASSPTAMNFVEPGGVALAAVELPETSFLNTDFSSAFFNVSVHKNLDADQCFQFAVPQPKSETRIVTKSAPDAVTPVASTEAASATPAPTPGAPATAQSAPAQPAASPERIAAKSSPEQPQGSKLLLGGLELRATEAVSGEGTRQSDSKYFHVFQSGSCYEFALNVTTVASDQGVTKHVDRDKVFARLEQILSTVKINPVLSTPEVTAETKTAPAVAETPAQ
jgi:hypothetical protein